ncbi:hypothetical protein AB0873_10960 [Micromonospora sp. NPDC047707]|uniref:TRAFAC clade GTPase domain-containing protein n=1 Tax=Micromonospora sp. NPDC047707 TaxID=3154498 RepID=UPI0034540B7B
MRERAEIVAKAWRPFCPNGHEIADSLDPVRVIGVIGNVNSSKSHYLAGLVYELIYQQPLRGLSIDVSYLGDSSSIMDARVDTIFSKREKLPNTERGIIGGPFMYRMTVGVGGDERSFILTFFDVAGEDCTSLRRSADFVRYIFDAVGIIVLVDPDGLPTSPTRPLSTRSIGAPMANRAMIDTLSHVIQSVTGSAPKDREQALVVALAKADKLPLSESVYPPPPLSGSARADIRTLLKEYSDVCRQEIVDLGGQGIVDAAVSKFGAHQVMFAAVSATGESPLDDGAYGDPKPVGCAMPVAQILLSRDDF